MGAATRPNVILIMTDDQGYGDLSCLGASDLQTPHLDALAAGGARCTQWYSNSPVCSPSRAALLTGRYPVRAGVRSILAGHRQATGLDESTPTLATALRAEGYRTAQVGKWHLGVAPESRPDRCGFDSWFGFLAGCIDYYSHIFYWGVGGGQNPVHDLWDNGQEVWRNGEYFTDLVTQRAVASIEQFARTPEQPFFLYLGYNAPHYPMHAPPEYLDRFPGLPWDRQIMAAMLSSVDDGVGAVVAALQRAGLRDDTLIFFQSDNGPSRESRNWLDGTPDPYYGGTAGGLKGHKFSLYDGGIKMPAILNWPAQVPAGQVIDEVGVAMDIFPTILRACGGDPSRYDLDGLDVLPVFTSQAASPHELIGWEQGHQTALRHGPWKLVLDGQIVEGVCPEDAVHLSDLRVDPGEQVNLAAQQPALCEQLVGWARNWRADLDRQWEERQTAPGRLTSHAGAG
ncbi:MAG: sulfatase-like hydrolase/transferase [Fimbriimonadaceae bacterium]|nr:sulfatase-like hydrolase/transferase [Fimbriimonadaceae bacterium]